MFSHHPVTVIGTRKSALWWRYGPFVFAQLLVFLLASLTLPAMASDTGPLWTEPDPTLPTIPVLGQLNDALIRLTERLLPAVVSLRVLGDETVELPKDHPPTPENEKPHGMGSGFLIRSDGLLLTNYHVVEKGTAIEVHLHNGDRYPATVVGQDPLGDLALLRIQSPSALPVAPFGRSSDLRVGEMVVAIGSPFGLQHTITFGIVSGMRRHLLGSGIVGGFIQTDASINTGNSGGPLINMQGEVIGVNTATVGRGELGFAIPIDAVKAILPQLLNGTAPVRGWLGVQIRPLELAKAEAMGLVSQRGVYVHDVLIDQPAQRAGIQPGDVIVRYDGQTVATPLDLQSAVASTPVGKKVHVEVYRKRALHTVELTVGSMPLRQ